MVPRINKALRARVLNEEAIHKMQKPWIKETPYDIRDGALADLFKAYDSALALYRKDGKIHVKKRSKRCSRQEGIVINSRNYNRKNKIYVFIEKIKAEHSFSDRMNYDCGIALERKMKRFYLYLPGERGSGSHDTKDVIALDLAIQHTDALANEKEWPDSSTDNGNFIVMETTEKSIIKKAYESIVKKVTTRHGWLGSYEYRRLFTPRIPYLIHSNSTPPFLAHKEELPILAAVIVGFQHALAMMGGIIAVPLILSGSGSNNLNLDDSFRTYMVASALIASGILSIIQIMGIKIGKTGYQLGTGLISVVGTSFTTLPVAQASFSAIRKHGKFSCAEQGPCPEAFGALLGTIMVCCWLEVAVSFLPPRILRRIFPPLVTGPVVVLIGASLVASGFQDWAGGSGTCYNYARALSNLELLGIQNISSILSPSLGICPSSEYAYQKYPWGDARWIGLGFLVFLTIIVIEIFGSPFMRTAEIMIGFLLGLLIASLLNYTNMESVRQAPAVTFLWTKTFPIRFYAPAIIPLLIVFIVLATEAMGDVTASMEASQLPVEGDEANGRLQGGILADGLNAFFGALMTTFPYSTFAQNNGVIAMTRCANIWAGYWCCFFLIIFGIFSKISALFVAIPDALLGGITTFLFANVVTSGIRILCFVKWTRRSRFIVACTLTIGLGATLLPEWFSSVVPNSSNSILQGLIEGVNIVMSTGFCIGAFVAILLHLILPIDDEPESMNTNLQEICATSSQDDFLVARMMEEDVK